MLATVRTGYTPALDRVGLAELRLQELDEGAAAELLDERTPQLTTSSRA